MQVRFDKSKLSGKVIVKDQRAPRVVVGSTSGDWLAEVRNQVLQCVPERQYGGCVPPNANLPPQQGNACNMGNVGKTTYVSLAPVVAISPATPWAAGAIASWLVRPDTGFKGEKIFIPALAILAGCTLESVLVQNNEQLSTPAIIPGTGVDVSIFFTTTLSDGAGRLSMQACDSANPIQLKLFNGSGVAITTSFSISIIGTAY
jgi:hypothetical protein